MGKAERGRGISFRRDPMSGGTERAPIMGQ